MARTTSLHFTPTAFASALTLAAGLCSANEPTAPPSPPAPRAAASAASDAAAPPVGARLAPVAVTGRAEPPASVAGWGDMPLSRTPVQASVFTAEQLKDTGARRLADLVGFDPAISDAYNTEGYWDYLTVRGFVLDNRFNFRRDGLPISAETSIPLDNKSGVEIIKGTSGIQAGTSAPGGLVNYVVKRPTEAPLRSASLEWREAGSVTGAVDLSQRFGADAAFGVRLNAAAAHLDPRVRAAEGHRDLVALAGDWRVGVGALLEVEVEKSHRSQPSVPGFSLLGNRVPAPVDPRINLNDQPWSQPVVLDGTTASLRWRQRLAADWRLTVHAATQRLRSDDRIAFPFGCTDPNPPPDGTYYADRYCPNGTFDLYDFRSDHEHRRTDAADASLEGRLRTGAIDHAMTVGVQRSRVHNRFQAQAYNFVGTGNVDGSAVTPADPTLTAPNTDRTEHSTELYWRDAATLTPRWTAWLGVRHTRLERDSIGTDGSNPTNYTQSFTTPWVGASYALGAAGLAYASWGRGVESSVVPNLPRYANAGQALPALKSRQVEIGLKGAAEHIEWNLAGFDIVEPEASDFGACNDDDASCVRRSDGTERHRGVEAGSTWRGGPWTLRAGAQWLHARREGSDSAGIDGKRPPNVPSTTLKAQAGYDVAAVPGLALLAHLAAESRRAVVPDNSASIAGHAQVDAALRYETVTQAAHWTWRAGVDNLFDRRAWRESPYQFSHAYLFPLAARTVRVSLQVDL